MSKSGQTYVAKKYGTEYTLYSMMRKMGIPLSPEQEEFQRHLEKAYPRDTGRKVS